MDHIGILERAVQTVRHNRALWILGFLWALMGGCSGPGGSSGSGGPNYRLSGGERVPPGLENLTLFGRALDVGDLIGIVALALVAVVLIAIVFTIIKYVLHAGVFRSLDHLHGEGTLPRVRAAVREGWHRRTWRLWLQNVIVDIPLMILAIVSLIAAILPALLVMFGLSSTGEPAPVGIVVAIGLFIGWLLAMLALGAIVGVLKQLWWRAAVVGDEGFLEALATGWRLFRRNLGDVAIMWLLMLGAAIVWAVVVLTVMVVFGALTGGVAVWPAYLMYQAGRGPWAFAYGGVVAFITFIVPLLFAGGLYLVFEASVWAQVYRELVARADLPNAAAAESPGSFLDES